MVAQLKEQIEKLLFLRSSRLKVFYVYVSLILICFDAIAADRCIQWGKEECRNIRLCESRYDECQAACYWVGEGEEKRAESCQEYCEENVLGCSYSCRNYTKCLTEKHKKQVIGQGPHQARSYHPVKGRCSLWGRKECRNKKLCESRNDECRAACYWVGEGNERRAESCQQYCKSNLVGCRHRCPDFKECSVEESKQDLYPRKINLTGWEHHTLVVAAIAFLVGILLALFGVFLFIKWRRWYKPRRTAPQLVAREASDSRHPVNESEEDSEMFPEP